MYSIIVTLIHSPQYFEYICLMIKQRQSFIFCSIYFRFCDGNNIKSSITQIFVIVERVWITAVSLESNSRDFPMIYFFKVWLLKTYFLYTQNIFNTPKPSINASDKRHKTRILNFQHSFSLITMLQFFFLMSNAEDKFLN